MAKIVRSPSTSAAALGLHSEVRLAPVLVEKATARLSIVTIISAISMVAFFIAEGFLQPESYAVQQVPGIRLLMLGMVLLSFGFLGVHRAGWMSKQSLLYLGAAFQVLQGILIGFMESTLMASPSIPAIGVSGVCLWITLCGVLIPNTPWLVAWTGTLTLFAWPLSYFLAQNLLHLPFVGWNRLLMWMLPISLAVVWTTLLNRRIYILELQSQKAEELGSYTLERVIGKGGMGEVWIAKHRLLHRIAAIKLIRQEMLSSQNMRNESMIRKRFEREAQATAQLRNPHTVALFDYGVTNEGLFYYVMELLDGVDLQTLVDKHGPMHPGRVKNILIQICESLEEAHRLKMVHRDVKPRNIFLSRLGWQHDFAKVLDFGLVKTEVRANETHMTLQGSATGTPAYMPPEVALNGSVDGRADIYSLGCVAYFMLTGELVFPEASATAMALAHVQKSPQAPSQRTEQPIPTSLENVVLQCLHKDPLMRPGSAQELARRLEGLADIPVFSRDMAEMWWEINLPGSGVPGASGIRSSNVDPGPETLDA
jgi:serine/threonine protein kinase